MSSLLSPLAQEQIADADAAIAGIDQLLVTGLTRVSKDGKAALARFASVFAGSPLADSVAKACDEVSKGAGAEQSLVVISAARSALLGSTHDALLSALADQHNLRFELPASEQGAYAESANGPLEGARMFLTELALTGFAQLDLGGVVPFIAALEGLQNDPALRRVSSALTGFVHELAGSVPVKSSAAIPTRRWADLFTRCLLLAVKPAPECALVEVGDARFVPWGPELRHHEHIATLTLWGSLEVGAERRVAKVSFARWKVDAVHGAETWRLFIEASELLSAMKDLKAVKLSGVRLRADGELSYESAELGAKCDPILDAKELLELSDVLAPRVTAWSAHPVHIAAPVFIEGGEWSEGVAGLPFASERTSPLTELTEETLATGSDFVGLIRYDDGQARFQPLRAAKSGKRKKGSVLGPTELIAKALKLKAASTNLAILEERASKLLRK